MVYPAGCHKAEKDSKYQKDCQLKGWAKIKTAAKYSGVSVRTLRKWLKSDLRHSRLPSGTILTKREWIDEYLESFEVFENEVDKITKEICEGL
jgi:hypothetical protein